MSDDPDLPGSHGFEPNELFFGLARGGLLFIEPHVAPELVAFNRARTWGQLKGGAPRLYREAMRLHGDDLPEPPADDDEFSPEQIPAYHDGDFPDFPEQMMLDLLPESIVERFGKKVATVHNGTMLVFRATDEDDIVSALTADGFRCVKRQDLIDQIS